MLQSYCPLVLGSGFCVEVAETAKHLNLRRTQDVKRKHCPIRMMLWCTQKSKCALRLEEWLSEWVTLTFQNISFHSISYQFPVYTGGFINTKQALQPPKHTNSRSCHKRYVYWSLFICNLFYKLPPRYETLHAHGCPVLLRLFVFSSSREIFWLRRSSFFMCCHLLDHTGYATLLYFVHVIKLQIIHDFTYGKNVSWMLVLR